MRENNAVSMFVAFAGLLLASQSRAATFEVYPTGNPENDAPHILAAVAAAGSGDIIVLKAGDGNGVAKQFSLEAGPEFSIVIDKPLTIMGEQDSDGAAKTAIKGTLDPTVRTLRALIFRQFRRGERRAGTPPAGV